MSRLDDLARRRRFDFAVLTDMRCAVFDFTAYANIADLNASQRAITDVDGAVRASKYRLVLQIPTLIGPGRYSDQTEIGVNTDVVDYPINEPGTWVISPDLPWSPHFRSGMPVCLGKEAWQEHCGHVTLGHLVLHLARLLNWDEKGRGSGYRGWNGDAIDYHRKYYRGRRLNWNLTYPTLPSWLAGGPERRPGRFEIVSTSVAPRLTSGENRHEW
jgi:hypothetical protein